MKRKTLRERQIRKAEREERRIERLKAKGDYADSFNETADINDVAETAEGFAVSENPTEKRENDKAVETISAMWDIAEKLGVKKEPQLKETEDVFFYEDEEQQTETDNAVEISAFDNYRKSSSTRGYQSRDNGRLFKFYNISMAMRILVLIAAVFYAVAYHEKLLAEIYTKPWQSLNLLTVFWLIVIISFLGRFIPGLVRNPGYQKEFHRYFVPTPDFDEEYMQINDKIKNANRGALLVLLSWVALNFIVGVLYFTDVIDEAVLVCIVAFYALSDVICILYYCPFQHLMLKNRCCMTCRIYNWDFMMICTPLIFIPSFYTWSLVLISLIILIRWEYVYRHYPERFFGVTNNKLRCVNCSSKLCRAKIPATATAKNLFGRK